METMIARGQCVEIGLKAHATQLFPAFHRIHRRPSIGVAMDEQHRTGGEIEGEFRCEPRVILVAAFRISGIDAIGERVGRIDRDRPLNGAGNLVGVIDRRVGAR